MVAFHDVRLPEVIEQGAHGGPTFSTSILTSTGGHEKRIGNWALPRAKWNIASGARDDVAFQALLSFFMARNGSLYGFRFKDWSDYLAPAGSPVVLIPGTTTYRLARAYTSGPVTFLRPISRPVSGAVTVSGGSVDFATGIVSGGSGVTWAGEFDIPVRFETDEFNLTLDQVDIGTAELTILELRE